MQPALLRPVLEQWSIQEFTIVSGDLLYGSPERSKERHLIENHQGKRFIVEKILPSAISRRQTIAENLDRLKLINPALPIIHYQKNVQNSYFSDDSSGSWMLSPYISHIPLNRLNYWKESWRGEIMAVFLINLKKASLKLPTHAIQSADPSLERYIPQLMETIRYHNPEVFDQINTVYQKVIPFFPTLTSLPQAFCHGDFHPINILWGNHEIERVIDWEFCSIKPKLYDVANMLGCLGMENPDSLLEGMAIQFIQTLRNMDFCPKEEWKGLLILIIANRFGWLSEWFRKHDKEMIQLEITYMDFLLQYTSELQSVWGI